MLVTEGRKRIQQNAELWIISLTLQDILWYKHFIEEQLVLEGQVFILLSWGI